MGNRLKSAGKGSMSAGEDCPVTVHGICVSDALPAARCDSCVVVLPLHCQGCASVAAVDSVQQDWHQVPGAQLSCQQQSSRVCPCCRVLHWIKTAVHLESAVCRKDCCFCPRAAHRSSRVPVWITTTGSIAHTGILERLQHRGDTPASTSQPSA